MVLKGPKRAKKGQKGHRNVQKYHKNDKIGPKFVQWNRRKIAYQWAKLMQKDPPCFPADLTILNIFLSVYLQATFCHFSSGFYLGSKRIMMQYRTHKKFFQLSLSNENLSYTRLYLEYLEVKLANAFSLQDFGVFLAKSYHLASSWSNFSHQLHIRTLSMTSLRQIQFGRKRSSSLLF